jgi:dihydroorotate dehydrogenase (fumarate)
MADLRTRYLGLDLRTPLVASASPLTGSLDGLRRLEEAGAAAVVLPSLFEEQLTAEADQVGRLLEAGAGSLPAALALDDYNAGPYGYLALVEKAKASLQIPVIASLNGVTPGAWVEHASLLEEAGADALELNSYYVSSSPGLAGSEVEWRYLELVGSVRQRIGIPLWSSSAPISARWPIWPASWSRRAPTGWCCSTASTSPTWTWIPWR